ANAPLGPKNLAVARTGSGSSVLSGAFVITNPRPANISVSPSAGTEDGGTGISISGQNFQTGAQGYFGGLPASNVQVVNTGLIQANAPSNSTGPGNVVGKKHDRHLWSKASEFA